VYRSGDLILSVRKSAKESYTYDDHRKGLTYEERLKKLSITTLETRSLCGDLIEVFKIFKGFDNIKHTDFFTISFTGLMGHEPKLFKPRVCLNTRKYFFTIRVLDTWNSLPATIINCGTLELFTNRIHCFFKDREFIKAP